MTSFYSPSQSAQLLIKYGETLPDYRKVRAGGVSSETGDQFANSSNCPLVLLKRHSRELRTNHTETLFFPLRKPYCAMPCGRPSHPI